MTILPTNKELFNRAENVTLTLELKNVPKIFVKIYEFHSENYYRATLKPITSNINLEGLIPAYEETHDFNHPKQVKFEHTFKFPQLNNKRGVFIIDFFSNGINSRAVIKKGSLSHVMKPNQTCMDFYVIDENKDICKQPGAGIWVSGFFYPANPEKGGKIEIPYQTSYQSKDCILLDNDFSEVARIEMYEDRYYLSVGYFIPQECLIVGN